MSNLTPASILYDANGAELATVDEAVLASGKPGLMVMGADSANAAHRLLTTNDGRLITSSAVSAPPGRTSVNQGAAGDVATIEDVFWTIPPGEQLVIQRFAGGGETDSAGSKCSLWYAPNGNTTGMTLIRAGYVNGNNFDFSLDFKVPDLGNGTRAILRRRERLTGGTVEIAAFWDGYY